VLKSSEDPKALGPCNVKDPLNDLPWLKKEINRLESATPNGAALLTTQFRKQRVFWFYSAPSAPVYRYANCEGKFSFLEIDPTPIDEETAQMAILMRKSFEQCDLITWSTPLFKASSKCK